MALHFKKEGLEVQHKEHLIQHQKHNMQKQ